MERPARGSTVTLEVPQAEGSGYLVDVELAPVGHRIGCVSLRVRAYAVDEDEQESFASKRMPLVSDVGQTVTASVVRRLPVGRLIDDAVRNQRFHARQAQGDVESMPPTFDNWLDLFGWPELKNPKSERDKERRSLYERQYALEREFFDHRVAVHEWVEELPDPIPSSKGGRPRISNELLRRVAEIYTLALDEGERAPSKAVAREMNINHGKARRWVMYARQRGFLPKTNARQARGILGGALNDRTQGN